MKIIIRRSVDEDVKYPYDGVQDIFGEELQEAPPLVVVEKKKKLDRCARIAKRKYKVWPSAYASGAAVKCRKGKIWKGLKEEQEVEENIGILSEIKLEQMGFPQEIVDRIRAIPSASVSKKLKPIEFERYIAWVGSILKNEIVGSLPLSELLTKVYLQIKNLVFSKLEASLAKTDPDSLENFQKVTKQLLRTINSYEYSSLPKLFNFAKQLNGFFDGYLPKLGVVVPDGMKEQVISTPQELINEYFKKLKALKPFAVADSMVSKKFAYFTSFLEKMNLDECYSIEDFKSAVKHSIQSIEDDKNILDIQEMPKGFYWYSLNVSECNVEAKRMGHCGKDDRGELYSLRSKTPNATYSESHVTISYNKNESTVYQVKGPGNSVPIKEYWPMIAAFFKHFKIERLEETGEYSNDKFGSLNKYLAQNAGVKIPEPVKEGKKKYKPRFDREEKEGLHGWFARNRGKGWVNCRTGGPCGRESADSGGKYPACRPTLAQCKSAGKGPLRKKRSSVRISWVKKESIDMKLENIILEEMRAVKLELMSEGMQYHIETKTSLYNPIYRPGSKAFSTLMKEAREMYEMGHPFTNEEAEMLEGDCGKYGMYEGQKVLLEVPMVEEELDEAEYHGKDVPLGKPQRGGSKKFYVYVKCGDNVRKISFGDPNLSVKISSPERRRSFVARHNCTEKNDRCTAGYWSCRIGRYPSLTGSKTRYTWW